MTPYLFGRAYTMTLVDPKTGIGQAFGNQTSGQSALRISFEVKQGVKDTPNHAKITAYNFNAATQKAVSGAYGIRLAAGYDNQAQTVFIGTLFKATSGRGDANKTAVNTKRQGPDILTEMEATDGQDALLNSAFNRAYPKATPVSQIVSDVASAMGLSVNATVGTAGRIIAGNQTLSGGCRQVLQVCLRPYGLEFNVLNNKLNIIAKGGHLGTQAIVVSAHTGLLGVPSLSDEGATFDCLLNPQLVPGQLVQLTCQQAPAGAFFKVRSATFVGDTRGDDWSVTCECARLPTGTVTASSS